ncbi:MAG: AMP-binding protein [Myxococcota bacterium]
MAPGDRVLLVYPPGLDFPCAFLGCLWAGVVAVPAAPPQPDRLGVLEGIAADCEPVAVLTTAALAAVAQVLCADSPALSALPLLATDVLAPGEPHPRAQPADRVAMLQYTSGSTGAPKGVVVSHGNLLHNEAQITRSFGHGPDSVVLGWLPVFHDMGLVGNVLQPLYLGVPCWLQSPVDFLKEPLGWLRAISRFGATTSGGPNFAYALCVRAAEHRGVPEDVALGGWRVAFNGAEPVRSATLDRFAEVFAPVGFRREAFLPCYGLAEGTLMVAAGAAGAGAARLAVDADALAQDRVAPDPDGQALVGCGRPWEGQQVAVVDAAGRSAGDAVGEIWVRGASVAQGYWRKPELTERTFRATRPDADGTWLRTGDLGFLRDGALFVTGRRKDLIVHRGRNLYPQDLEAAAEQSHPALRVGCGAAFGAEAGDEERVVLVQEVRDPAAATAAAAAIRAAVARGFGVQLHEVVLVPARTLQKTSSGKVRRRAARAAWAEGRLPALAVDAVAPAPEVDGTATEREVARICAEVLGRRVPLDAEFVALGGDSLQAAEILAGAEASFGVRVVPPPRPTARALAAAVDDALLATVAGLDDAQAEALLASLGGPR